MLRQVAHNARKCITTLGAICGLALSTAQAQEDSRPNFLIFTGDDMGYTDIGAFGGMDIPTPNLDRLAFEGVRLTNFHAAPRCAPTRAMLLSGNGNHEAGLGTQRLYPEYEGIAGYETRISDRVKTLPERLLEAGYHTYMAGKWHLGNAPGENLPADRGFERSFALLRGGADHLNVGRTFPYALNERFLRDLPENFYSTTAYVDHLIGFIDEHREDGKPFFAWFAPTAPHAPLQPPPAWRERFDGAYEAGYSALCRRRIATADGLGVLPAGYEAQCPKRAPAWDSLSAAEQAVETRVMELYAAMVAHLDLEFGRLLAYLEETGELENTYILFHNDNGPQGGATIRDRQGYNNALENLGSGDSYADYGQGWADAISAPFRGNKGGVFEGGTRVAAFVRPPEAMARGLISDSFLTVMDVLPTFMELAGVNEESLNQAEAPLLPIRGKSFASLIADPAVRIHGSEEAIALDIQGFSVVFNYPWKLVREFGSDHWLLFNLELDPSESRDLSAEHGEKRNQLVAAFEAHAHERGFVRRTSR